MSESEFQEANAGSEIIEQSRPVRESVNTGPNVDANPVLTFSQLPENHLTQSDHVKPADQTNSIISTLSDAMLPAQPKSPTRFYSPEKSQHVTCEVVDNSLSKLSSKQEYHEVKPTVISPQQRIKEISEQAKDIDIVAREPPMKSSPLPNTGFLHGHKTNSVKNYSARTTLLPSGMLEATIKDLVGGASGKTEDLDVVAGQPTHKSPLLPNKEFPLGSEATETLELLSDATRDVTWKLANVTGGKTVAIDVISRQPPQKSPPLPNEGFLHSHQTNSMKNDTLETTLMLPSSTCSITERKPVWSEGKCADMNVEINNIPSKSPMLSNEKFLGGSVTATSSELPSLEDATKKVYEGTGGETAVVDVITGQPSQKSSPLPNKEPLKCYRTNSVKNYTAETISLPSGVSKETPKKPIIDDVQKTADMNVVASKQGPKYSPLPNNELLSCLPAATTTGSSMTCSSDAIKEAVVRTKEETLIIKRTPQPAKPSKFYLSTNLPEATIKILMVGLKDYVTLIEDFDVTGADPQFPTKESEQANVGNCALSSTHSYQLEDNLQQDDGGCKPYTGSCCCPMQCENERNAVMKSLTEMHSLPEDRGTLMTETLNQIPLPHLPPAMADLTVECDKSFLSSNHPVWDKGIPGESIEFMPSPVQSPRERLSTARATVRTSLFNEEQNRPADQEGVPVEESILASPLDQAGIRAREEQKLDKSYNVWKNRMNKQSTVTQLAPSTDNVDCESVATAKKEDPAILGEELSPVPPSNHEEMRQDDGKTAHPDDPGLTPIQSQNMKAEEEKSQLNSASFLTSDDFKTLLKARGRRPPRSIIPSLLVKFDPLVETLPAEETHEPVVVGSAEVETEKMESTRIDARELENTAEYHELFDCCRPEYKGETEGFDNILKTSSAEISSKDEDNTRYTTKQYEQLTLSLITELELAVERERVLKEACKNAKTEPDKSTTDRCNELEAELSIAHSHLDNMEIAFNDLHSKYQKAKGVINKYKENEIALKKYGDLAKENLEKQKASYEKFKATAIEKLNTANAEMARMRLEFKKELDLQKAHLKRSELKVKLLEQKLQNEESYLLDMSTLCEDLLSRK